MVFHYLTFSLEENLKKLIENSFLVSDSSRSKLLKQLHRQLAEPSQSTAPTVPHAPWLLAQQGQLHFLRLRDTCLPVVVINSDLLKLETKLDSSYSVSRYDLHTTDVTNFKYTDYSIWTHVYICIHHHDLSRQSSLERPHHPALYHPRGLQAD